MKIIIKGGSRGLEIENFFITNILPLLSAGLYIEQSSNILRKLEIGHADVAKTVFTKDYPVAEVYAKLSPELISYAEDLASCSDEVLKRKAGVNTDEALAIRQIARMKPWFKVEYYVTTQVD